MKHKIVIKNQLDGNSYLKVLGRKIPVFFIGIPAIVVAIVIMGLAQGLKTWEYIFPHILTTLYITSLIWFGNGIIVGLIPKSLSWEKKPYQRAIIQSFLGVFYACVVVYSGGFFISMLYDCPVPSNESMASYYFIASIITLLMNAIFEGVRFGARWRRSILKTEVLKRANIQSQFNVLKNQVNPHFLFNSFNTLTALIEEEPTIAVKFVKELSDVYRYILTHNDKKSVSLEEEIIFLKKYFFLLQNRFGANLNLIINLPEGFEKEFVLPPLTLQILMENAVKHNIITPNKPLVVTITECGGQCLEIRNKLQRKTIMEDSTHIGLSNLKERYLYLSDKPLLINETEDEFIVKVPLLKP